MKEAKKKTQNTESRWLIFKRHCSNFRSFQSRFLPFALYDWLHRGPADKKHMASAYMFPLYSNNVQAEFPSLIQI